MTNDAVPVTAEDYALAEEIVHASNIVSHDGYYEVDIDRAAKVIARHRGSTAVVDGIFDIEPRVGAPTPEPSLRRIVRGYYNDHFDAVRAEELTDAYFASLSQTPATPMALPPHQGAE